MKPGLDVNNTNIYSDNNIEILSINPEGLTVTSIYKPPNTPFTCKDPPCHQSIEIVMGDFNSHNTIWGYDETNENGKAVVNIPPKHYFKRRFNFRKANWKDFKAESDSLISRL